jgi:hypothetical protein
VKRICVAAILVLFCLPTPLLAQGLLTGGYSLSSLTENVKVNPYAQVGFQWVGSNLNLPVRNQPLQDLPLYVGDLDISLKDANFWTGIAGVNVVANEKYSFFAAAGGLLNRSFVTAGIVPVTIDTISTSPTLEFTNTGMESWFIQTGIGVKRLLLGLYWSHFSFALGEPRNVSGPNQPNQTLRGDILTTIFCPFFGLAFPAGGATLTVTYSPLAYSTTALSITSSQGNLAQLRYTWKQPGQLLNAMFQYNTPFSSSIAVGFWGNYSWMRMRNDAELEFESTPTPLISRTRDVTATVTQFIVGGGVTLGMSF